MIISWVLQKIKHTQITFLFAIRFSIFIADLECLTVNAIILNTLKIYNFQLYKKFLSSLNFYTLIYFNSLCCCSKQQITHLFAVLLGSQKKMYISLAISFTTSLSSLNQFHHYIPCLEKNKYCYSHVFVNDDILLCNIQKCKNHQHQRIFILLQHVNIQIHKHMQQLKKCTLKLIEYNPSMSL